MKFGKIRDGRRKNMFSIIILGFPIIAYFQVDFSSKDGKRYFSNSPECFIVNFFYLFGFHISTKSINE